MEEKKCEICEKYQTENKDLKSEIKQIKQKLEECQPKQIEKVN